LHLLGCLLTVEQTTIGVLKLVPDAIQVSKDIWAKLRPPKEIDPIDDKEGVVENTFYSESKKFAISIPNNDWDFWKPSPQFLASMGHIFAVPNRSMPIIIMSKSVIKLFRPNVNVIVEEVGNYTNIEEMMVVTKLVLQDQGFEINDDEVVINNTKQCGQMIFYQKYLNSRMINVQNCYLRNGLYYIITACYVSMSDFSKSLFGGLQEIMNSFKILSQEK
jgi:hypothetical protein